MPKGLRAKLRRGIQAEISLLEAGNARLLDFMKTRYMDIVTRLGLDLRIFTGANLAIFSLLLIVSFAKPRAIAHLFLPGILLLVSTLISSYFYLFEQNWFFTIIYSDYVGSGYLAWVGLLFALLCDIVFNAARVSTQIINWIFQVLGVAAQLSPC